MVSTNLPAWLNLGTFLPGSLKAAISFLPYVNDFNGYFACKLVVIQLVH